MSHDGISPRSEADPNARLDASRYRQMVESAGEIIFTTDIQGYFDYVNPAVHGILGYQPGEVVGRYFGEFIVPEWREQVVQFYVDQLTGKTTRSVTEFPLASRSGEERWVELTVNLLSSAGKVTGFLGFLRDVSDRKAAEEALAEERNLLRTVIDIIPAAIYVKDRAHRIVMANAVLARFLGKESAADMIGLSAFDLSTPEDAKASHDEERAILEEGVSVLNREDAHPLEAGTLRWYQSSKVALRDSRGNIIGLVGVSRDITEQRQYERALQDARDVLEDRVIQRTTELAHTNGHLQQQIAERHRAEQALQSERNLLRTLIDHLPDYVYVKDLRSRFVLANWAVASKMGARSPEAMIGRTDFDFYPPEAAAQFYGDERQVILSGKSLMDIEELSLDFQTNRAQWVLTSKIPLHDADGNVTGLVGIGRDITNRKASEQQQREHQEFLRQLIDNNPSLIFVKDWDGRFHLVNKSLADLYGTTVEAIIGKTDADFNMDSESIAHFMEDDRDVISTLTPKFIPEEKVYNVATGEWRWVQTSKLPFQQADGSYHVLGIATDITERRNAEKQTLDLAVERERVRLLANFIRDASHDFRTPLSTINTSLYLLSRSTDAEKQRHHVDVIQQQTAHLGKLLEGMLKMTRLDSEHLFRYSAVDVNALLATIHYRDSAAAARKSLDFRLALDERRFVVKADMSELERALTELIKNAIHYTPEGKTIRLSTTVDGDEGVVTVEDTGIGIDPEDQARVFERFYRADKARSTDTGGVGLGLSIAQKIIEAHGGRITLESVPGDGSVFRVYLPLRADEAKRIP